MGAAVATLPNRPEGAPPRPAAIALWTYRGNGDKLAAVTTQLFVYGSLGDADVRSHVLGTAANGVDASAASAPGYRVVVFPGRSYPALLAASDSTADGLLLAGLSAADLVRLDLFEGPEYFRRPIELIVTGRRLAADVYWPVLPIPDGAPAWRLPDWQARHKAAFLAAEAGRHA